jgi:hypothetical protein
MIAPPVNATQKLGQFIASLDHGQEIDARTVLDSLIRN